MQIQKVKKKQAEYKNNRNLKQISKKGIATKKPRKKSVRQKKARDWSQKKNRNENDVNSRKKWTIRGKKKEKNEQAQMKKTCCAGGEGGPDAFILF